MFSVVLGATYSISASQSSRCAAPLLPADRSQHQPPVTDRASTVFQSSAGNGGSGLRGISAEYTDRKDIECQFETLSLKIGLCFPIWEP